MPDYNYYELPGESALQQKLAEFTRVLRGLGIRVSTAEVLDALRALAAVEIASREQFKTALGSTLVKRKSDRQLFELAFDSFFASPEIKEQQVQEEYREEEVTPGSEVEKELHESVSESGGRWAGNAQEYLELSEEQKETLARMPAGEREKLQQIIESYEGNPVNDPSRVIANVVEASLNYWRYYLNKQEERREHSRVGNLQVDYAGDPEIDGTIDYVSRHYSQEREESLLHKDMQSIGEEELSRVTAIITRLSRKLATRISRRYKRSSSRSKLDVRGTIRKSVACGGVPVTLVYRSKRVSKPRLVMLCDVSASMVRYARFIIQFIYGLSHVVRDVETFIFAEDVERITPYFAGRAGFSATMSALVSESGQWGKTTNLNTALYHLDNEFKHIFAPETYFIIVSDTKTQQAGEASRRVEAAGQKIKELIWLNTLPGKEWGEISTVELFRKQARMFECGTVAQLDEVLTRQLL